jgi:thiamine biosynthesis lipoprotein
MKHPPVTLLALVIAFASACVSCKSARDRADAPPPSAAAAPQASSAAGVNADVNANAATPTPDGNASAEHLVERARVSMGSSLRLTAWTADDTNAIAAFNVVFAEFDRLDALLSVWREGSDVQHVNAAAGRHPVPVGPEFLEVVGRAREISEWTDGKFDITFGALSDLWKFDHDQNNRVPTPDQIRPRLPLIDYRALAIDDAAHTAFLTKPGMRVHLGGIGKGYAVDRGARLLREHGVHNFMIQSGGDLYVGGHRDGRPWRASIRDPRGPADKSFAAVDLSDETFSTSGDYERFFMKDGRRYHHILDPDSGEPANECRSVTIVAKNATLADGLSTGVFILGPARGLALIERLPDVEGVIVGAHNEVLVSSGLGARIEILGTPTDAP